MGNIRKGDRRLIQDINRNIVVNTVRESGPISRTAVAKITNLEISTVTNITKYLLEKNLVKEVGEGKSSGGRKPILLEFNYDYGKAIGIKIEVDRILVGITRLNGKIIKKLEKGFPRKSKPAKVIELIKEGINELDMNPAENVIGIGLAVSGFPNDVQGVITYSPILNWRNVELAEPLQSHYRVPVFIENDVNAFTLAEKWYGKGQEHDNFVCVTIGEGIGAGIVIEGELYEGAIGGAGELGHTCIQKDGLECRCGERGCLEVYASDTFLKREGKDILSDSSPESIIRKAKQGNKKARTLLEEMGHNLGIGLKNVVNLLNPEAIIIGGERAGTFNFIASALEEEIRRHSFPEEAASLEILPAELGKEGWIIGAATLVTRDFFKLPLYAP